MQHLVNSNQEDRHGLHRAISSPNMSFSRRTTKDGNEETQGHLERVAGSETRIGKQQNTQAMTVSHEKPL